MSEFEDFWSDVLGTPDAPVHAVKSVEELKESGTPLVVDGDVFVYRAAAATEGRYYTHPGTEVEFKYKKDADKYCEEKELDTKLLKLNKRPEPFTHAKHNLDMMMRSLSSEIEGDLYYIIWLSSDSSFRVEFNPEYKAHRKSEDRPFHLDALRKYYMEAYGAKVAMDGLEADDMCGITATTLGRMGRDYVIISNDKDLLGIPGRHFNPFTGEERHMTETESLLFFYKQVLTGDSVDNIKGLEGCGPKTADKILQKFYDTPELATEKRVYHEVLTAYYKKMYNDAVKEWKKLKEPRPIPVSARTVCLLDAQRLLFDNARMLWILREPYVMWMPPPRSIDVSTISEETIGETKEETKEA